MIDAAVILAGGRSQRLGRPKESVVVAGESLLDRSVRACGDTDTIVVVGPPRPTLARDIVQVREEPAHGGPVAALASALPILASVGARAVLVLACDMPRVEEVVAALRPVELRSDAIIARDRGRGQPLAAVYRREALASTLGRFPVEGASMRSVLADLRCTFVDVADGCTDDVDSPADLARLVRR